MLWDSHRHFITLLLGPEEKEEEKGREGGEKEGTTHALAKTEGNLDQVSEIVISRHGKN